MEFIDIPKKNVLHLIVADNSIYETVMLVPFSSPGVGSAVVSVTHRDEMHLAGANPNPGNHSISCRQIIYSRDIAKSTTEKLYRRIRKDLSASIGDSNNADSSAAANLDYKNAGIVQITMNKYFMVYSAKEVKEIFDKEGPIALSINQNALENILMSCQVTITQGNVEVRLNRVGIVMPKTTDGWPTRDNPVFPRNVKWIDIAPSRVELDRSYIDIYTKIFNGLTQAIADELKKHISKTNKGNINVIITSNWW